MARGIVQIPRFWNAPVRTHFPEGWEDWEVVSPSHPRWKEIRESRPTVGVCIPTYGGMINISLSTALVVAGMNMRTVFCDRSGTYIAKNRNDMMRRMLALGCDREGKRIPGEVSVDYIVLFDSDMIVEPDTIVKMIGRADALAAPVLSAAYMKKGSGEPVFGVDAHLERVEDRPEEYCRWFREQKWQWGDLVECDWAGMGGLAIRRDVLEVMDFPYMIDFYRNPDLFIGEDIEWCRYLRILRIPILVDTSIPMGHQGAAQLCPNQRYVSQEELDKAQEAALVRAAQVGNEGKVSEGNAPPRLSRERLGHAANDADGGGGMWPPGYRAGFGGRNGSGATGDSGSASGAVQHPGAVSGVDPGDRFVPLPLVARGP